jgi:hypothetical protein
MDNAHPLLNKQTIDNDQGLTKEQTSIPAWLPYVIASIMFFGGLGVAAIGLSGYLGALQMTDLEAIIVMGSGGGAALIGIVIAGVNFYVHKRNNNPTEEKILAPKEDPNGTLPVNDLNVFGAEQWNFLNVSILDHIPPPPQVDLKPNEMLIFIPKSITTKDDPNPKELTLKVLKDEVCPGFFGRGGNENSKDHHNIDARINETKNENPAGWVLFNKEMSGKDRTPAEQGEYLSYVGHKSANTLEVIVMGLMSITFNKINPLPKGEFICGDDPNLPILKLMLSANGEKIMVGHRRAAQKHQKNGVLTLEVKRY